MLSASGLKKRYKQREVVRDFACTVNEGEVVGLLGPNGAGKTTCFYMIVGLIAADAGSIRLDDQDITGLPMHARARLGVGYLPQEANALEGRIRTLEQHSHRSGQTQLFIETPFRNQLLWGAMVRTLQPSTRLAYARSLTLDDADCRCSTVANWRKNGGGPVNGTPAVFAFGP